MSDDTNTTGAAETQDSSQGLILVADDDHISQLFIQRLLEQAGYRTELVADGQQAVSALENGHHDLVLMDCNMPVIDGFAATRHIRGAASPAIDPEIPVIALTGATSLPDQLRCTEAGMDAWVSKPADPQTLIAAIEKCLRGRRADRATARQVRTPGEPAWDDGFLETLIASFLEELPETVAALQLAARHGNLSELKSLAHRLRGPAGVLGFSTLSSQTKALDDAGGAGDLALATRLASELIDELQALKAVLQE